MGFVSWWLQAVAKRQAPHQACCEVDETYHSELVTLINRYQCVLCPLSALFR